MTPENLKTIASLGTPVVRNLRFFITVNTVRRNSTKSKKSNTSESRWSMDHFATWHVDMGWCHWNAFFVVYLKHYSFISCTMRTSIVSKLFKVANSLQEILKLAEHWSLKCVIDCFQNPAWSYNIFDQNFYKLFLWIHLTRYGSTCWSADWNTLSSSGWLNMDKSDTNAPADLL